MLLTGCLGARLVRRLVTILGPLTSSKSSLGAQIPEVHNIDGVLGS